MSLRGAYPIGLGAAGLLVALAVVLPYRPAPFLRADGVTVALPAPTRLHHTSDTFDYLQIARQVWRGCGYTSLFTYPPFLPESARFLAPETSGSLGSGAVVPECPPGFPVFWRQPGFPLLIASAFALRGAADPGVLPWVQGTAVFLLPLVTFLLAGRLLTPGWAALAGLWTVLSPLAVGANSPFNATTWFAVLLAIIVTLLLSVRRPIGLLLLGLWLGVAALFRLETWLLLPGILIMVWLGRSGRRTLALAWVLVPAAITVIPWHLYLAALTGDPFYNTSSLIFHATEAFPGWESSRTLAVRDLSPWGFAAGHAADLLRKTAINLARFGRDLVLLPSPLLAPFLWLALLRPPVERGPRAYLAGGTVAVACLVLVLAPMEYAPRFLGGLVPLLAVGATLGLSRFPRYRRTLAVVATGVGIVLLAGTLAGRKEQGTALLAALDLNRIVPVAMASPDWAGTPAVLCDAPTVYAWIWDRPAVWTPVPADAAAVRALLPGHPLALFTRTAGRGDDFDPDIVEDYVKTGGQPSAPAPPLVISWPGGTTPAAEELR